MSERRAVSRLGLVLALALAGLVTTASAWPEAAPTITSVDPARVRHGTIVTVKGTSLPSRVEDVAVTVSGMRAIVVWATPDTIRFIVPKPDTLGRAPVVIRFGDIALTTSLTVERRPARDERDEESYQGSGFSGK